jgi:2-polyprenyl-6-hydroxyphenyl methylase/3-demethylubiquinone-9 3-methyltransferase
MSESQVSVEFDQSVARGERFEFGKNWQRFLSHLNENRILEAERSLKEKLQIENLSGCSFLDIGCGSGLFSLAAKYLGAESVVSFDYDTQSTACCRELKSRFFPDHNDWTVEQASVLDNAYLNNLGTFDIVYSWGVLHHTGNMWKSFENIDPLVKPGGTLFIAIYNDQGLSSRNWHRVKHLYNWLPSGLRWLVLYPAFLRLWGPTTLRDLLRGKPGETWRTYASDRGMSPWDDVVDWVGGYPFEVARPGDVFTFFHRRGYTLTNMFTTHNIGCNEFVFHKDANNNIKQVKTAQ